MAGVEERKRKGVLELDFGNLIGRDDDPPPELLILQTEEGGKDLDPQVDNYFKKLSDEVLSDKIERIKKFLLKNTLSDGGEKMRIKVKGMEAELERRSRQKDIDKCKKVTALADESTCDGATKDLSHPGAPQSKPASDFCLLFCSNLDNGSPTQCFGEEVSTLNRSNHKRIRENRPVSAPITQKKSVSSRQAPFKSPSFLSVNIDNQKQTRSHAPSPSPHRSNGDSSCCSTKKEGGARTQPPRNSRRNNRKAFVLVDEEELEVDVVNEVHQVGQSSKDTRIYYPSRTDPEAIEICYSDMECLAPETYLSSPIMNFYIRYLQMPTSPSARSKHDYHIFNTYFYEKLKQDVLTQTDREASFLKFRRWWKGVNIFEKAYIFLPIHESLHWSLVIICIPNKEDELGPIILHLDSLGLHNSSLIFSNVKSFLIEEWMFLKKEEELPELPTTRNFRNRFSRKIDENVIEVPRQRNDYDCGVFVLFFMERFLEEAPERLTKLNSEMFGRQWFRPEEASSLRRKIRNLLSEEFKKSANEGTFKLDS